MNSAYLWTSFRLAPTFSGLALLLGLLVALPWLPLDADTTAPVAYTSPGARAPAPIRAQPYDPSIVPLVLMTQPNINDDNFILHIVATDDDVAALRAKYRDEVRDIILVISLEDREALSGFRSAALNSASAGDLPSIKVRDHRCNPIPPSPSLCESQ